MVACRVGRTCILISPHILAPLPKKKTDRPKNSGEEPRTGVKQSDSIGEHVLCIYDADQRLQHISIK